MSCFAKRYERKGELCIDCIEDDFTKQPQCDYYMPHPERTDDDRQYCWFNYDVEDRITNECRRPGVLRCATAK